MAQVLPEAAMLTITISNKHSHTRRTVSQVKKGKRTVVTDVEDMRSTTKSERGEDEPEEASPGQ